MNILSIKNRLKETIIVKEEKYKGSTMNQLHAKKLQMFVVSFWRIQQR